MNYHCNDSGERAALVLEGELSIQSASQLKELLMPHREKQVLLVDLNAVSSLDLSAMQLLCSLHRTMLKSGRQLSLAGGVPAALRQVLEDAGFLRERGCALDTNRTCLWLKARCADE